jgi:hypothetical protein
MAVLPTRLPGSSPGDGTAAVSRPRVCDLDAAGSLGETLWRIADGLQP